jgi:dihydrofolate reductase
MQNEPATSPAISIVVAVARNGVIGRDNGLPWRLSTDLKRFRAITMGKPVIMGRKTFQSIGKPLPGRPNIVITRDPAFAAEGVTVARSLADGIDAAREQARSCGAAEICVIGGGEIYRQVLARADRLYVTEVDAAPEGDTTFPQIDRDVFDRISEEAMPAGERDSHSSRLVVYQRRS